LFNNTIVIALTTAMDDEFSITLPSNVFSKEDPNNSPSKFVTRLSKTIQLSGTWEVAATRLQLQNRWYNFAKSQLLGVYVRDIRTVGEPLRLQPPGTEVPTTLLASVPNYNNRVQRFEQVASQWKGASWATDAFVKNMTYKCVTFPAGVYTSVEHMGNTLCNQIMLAFDDVYEDLDLTYSYFDLLGGNVRIHPVEDLENTKPYVVRIVSLASPTDLDVMEVLGFTPEFKGVSEGDKALFKFYGRVQFPTKQEVASMDLGHMKHYCYIHSKVVDKPAVPLVSQLMLYADVAALSNVGNIEAQLLDSVVVHVKQGEYEDALRGVTPNYVPVYRNTFSTIEIELTDHAGDQLCFPTNGSSPVIVTLRFRRVKSNK
jgi:hypothetical protein